MQGARAPQGSQLFHADQVQQLINTRTNHYYPPTDNPVDKNRSFLQTNCDDLVYGWHIGMKEIGKSLPTLIFHGCILAGSVIVSKYILKDNNKKEMELAQNQAVINSIAKSLERLKREIADLNYQERIKVSEIAASKDKEFKATLSAECKEIIQDRNRLEQKLKDAQTSLAISSAIQSKKLLEHMHGQLSQEEKARFVLP